MAGTGEGARRGLFFSTFTQVQLGAADGPRPHLTVGDTLLRTDAEPGFSPAGQLLWSGQVPASRTSTT